MRNLLALLGAALVTFAAVGWYLNWYSISNEPSNQGRHSVHIDIDKDKIGKDLHKGGEKLHDALEKARSEDGKKKDAIRPAVDEDDD